MSDAAARVVFTTGFSRRYTGGVTEFQVAAKTLRGVIREMDRKFPGLAETLEEETTVAIDGSCTRSTSCDRSGRERRCSLFRRSRGDRPEFYFAKNDAAAKPRHQARLHSSIAPSSSKRAREGEEILR